MSDEADSSNSQERRVGALIAAYLEALDRGESPDRDALLRQHPACARELESFFADQDQLRGLVRAGAQSEVIPAAAPMPSATATLCCNNTPPAPENRSRSSPTRTRCTAWSVRRVRSPRRW